MFVVIEQSSRIIKTQFIFVNWVPILEDKATAWITPKWESNIIDLTHIFAKSEISFSGSFQSFINPTPEQQLVCKAGN